MASYFLDTGILLGYVRGAGFAAYVETRYAPSKPPNIAATSVVSRGELFALALRRDWRAEKREALGKVLQSMPTVPVRHPTVLEKYAEIDAFNHRQHPSVRPPSSGHTMGGNDIWIAATAAVLNATFLTTDRDFDHLDKVFLNVIYIDQSLTPTSA